MADLHQDSANSGADFDLSQFYQIFFEEASENLDQMEQMLLSLDLSAANDEELNGIFRCAHSIKGGAATFGFSDTGESLGRLTTAFGRRVVAALHLPANLHPPGFTVITSRVRGRLQVTVGWLDGTLTDDEIAAFERALRAELLG